MTPERFEALAAAYGGRVDRWPDAERDAAAAFVRAHPASRAALDREAGLDRALASWDAAAAARGPSAALAGRLASGIAARSDRFGRMRLRWSGLWATGALAAGAAAGVLAVAVTAASPPDAAAAPFAGGLTVLGAPVAADPEPPR